MDPLYRISRTPYILPPSGSIMAYLTIDEYYTKTHKVAPMYVVSNVLKFPTIMNVVPLVVWNSFGNSSHLNGSGYRSKPAATDPSATSCSFVLQDVVDGWPCAVRMW